MDPATRRRFLIVAGVVVLVAAVATLAGVLGKTAVDNRRRRTEAQQAAPAPAPAASPVDPVAGPAAAVPSSSASMEQPDPKAPFYPESQSPSESLFMASLSFFVLGPDALMVAAQSGDMPLAYAGPGPCRTLRAVGNVSLDLSAAATGCRGAQCAITLHVTLPAPGSCAAFPGPRETVYLISGYSCGPQMYKAYADHLASWGYAVLQYDRPLNGLFTPASETESAYLTQIMTWRNHENNTRGSSFAGQFAAGPIAVMGHSMGGGLTAILSGILQEGVGAAVMIDPVDYTQLSLRVARQYLAEYRQPVLIMSAAVHCIDRNGCVPPQDHTPSSAEEAALVQQGLCRPNWWCCDWDDRKPGMETKTAAGLTSPTDGPSGFIEFAANGSWLARFGQAGHTAFMDAGTAPMSAISCPTVEPSAAVQPDAMALAAAFLATRLRGEQGAGELAAMWAAAKPPTHLSFGTKGEAVAAAR
ncbi:hypothetical protein ABPG75_003771 [Micractinium tetrahymenae]